MSDKKFDIEEHERLHREFAALSPRNKELYNVTDNDNIFGIPKREGKPKRQRKVKDNRFPPGTRVRYTRDWLDLQERLGRMLPHYEGRQGVVSERSLNPRHLRVTWDDAVEPVKVNTDFIARA